MNKLKILKRNLYSTVILTFAMFICLLCSLLILPIGINYLIGWGDDKNLEFYSEQLAEYCVIEFPSDFYKYLETKFDMENFAGIAYVGDYIDKFENAYAIKIVSEKMVKELPSLEYNFSKTKPKDYKEAFAPYALKNECKIGDFLKVSCYKGVYEYTQKIKIIGFTDKEYYDFSYYNTRLSNMSKSFLIYDEIPPYAKVSGGLMMSSKTPDYYANLGAKSRTLSEQFNDSQNYSHSSDSVLSWSASLLVMLMFALAANYYFSVDKMTKRSGIMAIYGARRSELVTIELFKLVLIFVMAFALSAISVAIMISAVDNTITWLSYFIGLSITFFVYVVSLSLGFIKFARFKPLQSLSNDKVE